MYAIRRHLSSTRTTLGAGIFEVFLAQWSQDHGTDNVGALVALLATGVAVVGWYQSTRLEAQELREARHLLQTAAQRKLLHLQLLNEARHEIRRAVTREEDRLRSCSTCLHVFRFTDPITQELRTKTARVLWEAALHPVSVDWIIALEENAALFPEVRVARLQMIQRQTKLQEELHRYVDVLNLAASLPRHFDEGAKDLWDNINDQSALLVDLRIHIQSRALRQVSGHSVPERRPPDDRVPRLVMDEDDLVIYVPDPTRRVQMEVANWLPPRNPPGS